MHCRPIYVLLESKWVDTLGYFIHNECMDIASFSQRVTKIEDGSEKKSAGPLGLESLYLSES